MKGKNSKGKDTDLTRASLGGGQNLPHTWFFKNNSKTVADIHTKFSGPYSTSI